MDLRTQLIGFEGWKNKAYPDPLTGGKPWTIGVGHCGPEVFEGLAWSDEKISQQLDADILEKTNQAIQHIPWFGQLNEPRQAVIVGMIFQIGIHGVLEFHNTLASMRDERWADAANGMRSSLWAKQTQQRANRLARQMETGEWN